MARNKLLKGRPVPTRWCSHATANAEQPPSSGLNQPTNQCTRTWRATSRWRWSRCKNPARNPQQLAHEQLAEEARAAEWRRVDNLMKKLNWLWQKVYNELNLFKYSHFIKCHTVPDSVPGSRFSSRFSSRFDKLGNNCNIHGNKSTKSYLTFYHQNAIFSS